MLNPLQKRPRPVPVMATEPIDTPWQIACKVVGLDPTIALTFGRFGQAKGRITLSDQTAVHFKLREAKIDPITRVETFVFMMDVNDSWIGAFMLKGYVSQTVMVARYQPICVTPGTVHMAHFRINEALFWRLDCLGQGSMTLEAPIEKAEWEAQAEAWIACYG